MKFVHFLRWEKLFAVSAAFLLLGFMPGCGTNKTAATRARQTRPPGGTNQQSLVIAPATSPSGRVASVNARGRFLVIVFPLGQMLPENTRLSVFRGEARTGEIKITGPTQDNLTVADILSGGAQENDEVRAE